MIVGQEIIIVDPVRDARKPARIVDGNARRTVEQFLGVENIVDLGVFEHAVRMDARTRRIERPADKRRARRDYVAEFLFEIARDIGDGGEIHAVVRAAQRSVLDRHRFERAVARAFADAEQRTVDRARPVQPRRRRVGDHFIKIVVPVPFEKFARHFRMVMQTVYKPLHAARNARSWIGDAESHRIAHTDLDGNAALAGKFHQLVRKRHDKTVKVRARQVFEVTARLDAVRQRALDDAEIFVHRLRARQVHLFKDVIIRTADENARFGNARLFDEFEVLFVRADPRRDLGEFQAEILAFFQRAAILFAVQEKLALTDDALRPAQT